MEKLEAIDGSRFLINPSVHNDVLLGRFKQYPEFSATLSFDKPNAIRYIILMYDINNQEIQALFPDYMTRKRSCAVMAGFSVERNRFAPDVELALVGKNDEFNRMIIRYVRMFNNPDYVSYVSYWEMLTRNVELSISENDPKIIKEIRVNIDNLRSQLSDITKSIFRGDDSSDLRKALYATMEEEKVRLRPELMAEAILRKNLVFSKDSDAHKTIAHEG